MRREFGKVIVELAEAHPELYLLVGDIGYRIFDEFRSKFPKRFLNMGICEQSMISVAAGMAHEGIKPVVYTITPFLIERPFEQVKLDIDEQKSNVLLVGYADYPYQGPTHSELNNSGVMRQLKNTPLYFPKDSIETRVMASEAFIREGPAFMSLKEDKTLKK